jgi:hypothetical protein
MGNPQQKVLFPAIVYKYYESDVPNNNPGAVDYDGKKSILIRAGSVQARIPGIDYDVPNNQLRLYRPFTQDVNKYMSPEIMIYVSFSNLYTMQDGYYLGRMGGSETNPDISIKDLARRKGLSTNMILGCRNSLDNNRQSPFVYDDEIFNHSREGTFPRLMPVLYEDIIMSKSPDWKFGSVMEGSTSDGIKLFSNKKDNTTIYSSGGGRIAIVDETSINLIHGKFPLLNNLILTTRYQNLIPNSSQNFSKCFTGSFVDEKVPLAKISQDEYLYFKMYLGTDEFGNGGVPINPLLHVGFPDSSPQKPLAASTSSDFYFPSITLEHSFAYTSFPDSNIGEF